MCRLILLRIVIVLGVLAAPCPSHAQGRCSWAKLQPDGATCTLTAKRVTAVGGGVPADYAYIEDIDRASGIMIHKDGLASDDLGIGDEISVTGTISTLGGEKYIDATSPAKTGAYVPLDALGMNNRDAEKTEAQGLFIKTWGKVTYLAGNYFKISDGSATPIMVACGSLPRPALNSVIRVRGIARWNVLYMRPERADWIDAGAAYQPLPFPGKYRYVRDWLVLGPFRDASHSNDYELLDVDFIKSATGVDEVRGDTEGGRRSGRQDVDACPQPVRHTRPRQRGRRRGLRALCHLRPHLPVVRDR